MADEKKTTPAPEAAAPAPAAAAPKAEGENKAAPSKAGPAQSPWLPVIVVILIMPVLSFVMTDMVMIPRVKKALGDITRLQQESAQPAAGGPLPTEHKDKGKDSKDGKEISKSVKFDNVVANLSGSMKSRFLKVSFEIEGDDDSFKATIEANKTKIIDSALGVLGGLSVTELDEPGTKNIIRSDLIDAFNQVLEKPIVKRLYFSELVIQ